MDRKRITYTTRFANADILDEFMKHNDIEFSYPTGIIYTEDEKNRIINKTY